MQACIHIDLGLILYLTLLCGLHQKVPLGLHQTIHVLILLLEDLLNSRFIKTNLLGVIKSRYKVKMKGNSHEYKRQDHILAQGYYPA